LRKLSKEKVLVAMSGGVDSSVAAALLKERGLTVIGATMRFNISENNRKPIACAMHSVEDARRVADSLKIRHCVFDYSQALEKKVIGNFLRQYLCGVTPNPCVRCNQYLKFGFLLEKAFSLGCYYLATGHYSRVIFKQGSYFLKKAKDASKDQSYFLYRLTQNKLRHILFPVGDLLKEKVRYLARKFNLPIADKLASQEICFIPANDYRQFLRQRLAEKIKPGKILDKYGNCLGRHSGICFYTIGQREGLGIARGYPLFVTKIEPKGNLLYVGERKEVLRKVCTLKNTHFIYAKPKNRFELFVKIRYNHKEALATLEKISGSRYRLSFKETQFAITPGQSAVFYAKDKETVLGGGIIEKVIT